MEYRTKEGKYVDDAPGHAHPEQNVAMDGAVTECGMKCKNGKGKEDHDGKQAAEKISHIQPFIPHDLIKRELPKSHGLPLPSMKACR